MKRTAPVRHAPATMSNDFVRGFATTALLLTAQPAQKGQTPGILRHALRGGTALAAGVAAANAFQRREYGSALLAAALGAAGLAAIDYVMHPLRTDSHEDLKT